jgi:hypothetical protein
MGEMTNGSRWRWQWRRGTPQDLNRFNSWLEISFSNLSRDGQNGAGGATIGLDSLSNSHRISDRRDANSVTLLSSQKATLITIFTMIMNIEIDR